ncbi:beta-D-glucoside glucohydrolase [Bacteroidales bacterium]|nr:beta-D-glucoside glucohydrolase [Bacteroidales bacterium]
MKLSNIRFLRNIPNKHTIAMRKYIISLYLIGFSLFTFSQNYPFRNPDLPIDARVNDLISRLSLDEKVKQMMNDSPAIDRLGIPKNNWWNECLHGVGRSGEKVTVFPQAIAMAATFDVDAMKRMGDITSDEARAIYHQAIRVGEQGAQYKGLTFWTPNINIFRDPRWGRGQETYGEDPYLTAQMGDAIVRGLQGSNPQYMKTSACAKHYAVHSGPEKGRHEFDATVSQYDLWDTYLPAFRELVVNSKVSSVMCAYNRYDGEPCCASDLLTGILRNQWQFDGYVTSDCGAIYDFYKFHKTHADATIASVDALIHGTDLECGTDYKKLLDAVESGMLTERQIDVSLKRLLSLRFKLGMFDPPSIVPYSNIPYSILESPEHQQHALQMAQKSMVLLKNKDNTLPLSKKIKSIAIIGPNADNEEVQLGNYNGFPSKIITVRQGIQDKLGANVKYISFPATDYTTALGKGYDLKKIADKVKNADVILFVGGISPRLEGEEGDAGKEKLDGFEGGDRTDIALPAIQTNLMKELKATGKPVVFVNMSGSAVAMPWEDEHVDAILQAWYGGQSAGTAVADILFGDYNPSGKLPVTFYRKTEDLPHFHDFSMENRTYRYFSGKVLYPFGYGLSYTSFKYEMPQASLSTNTGEPLVLVAKVTNTGSRDGDEVVQLYVRHLVDSENQSKPIHALQNFERIHLKAGESKEVRFQLSPRNLALVDNSGNLVQKAGRVQIFIAGGQPDASSAQTIVSVNGDSYSQY